MHVNLGNIAAAGGCEYSTVPQGLCFSPLFPFVGRSTLVTDQACSVTTLCQDLEIVNNTFGTSVNSTITRSMLSLAVLAGIALYAFSD